MEAPKGNDNATSEPEPIKEGTQRCVGFSERTLRARSAKTRFAARGAFAFIYFTLS